MGSNTLIAGITFKEKLGSRIIFIVSLVTADLGQKIFFWEAVAHLHAEIQCHSVFVFSGLRPYGISDSGSGGELVD